MECLPLNSFAAPLCYTMALGMARPHKHPRTGVYWFRRRVPERLRTVVGKTEEIHSLKTKTPRSPRHASWPS